MRLLVISALFAVLCFAPAQEPLPSDLSVVIDLERPSDTDVLLLRNGDQLTGTILNDSFSIRTSYAEIVLNNRVVAAVDLEGGASNIESIITVNDNRFSGFIDDPVFVFRLQSGPLIEVRREKVLKAVFRVREQEREGIPQRQFATLKNGDFFSGQLLNSGLIAATTYADVPLDLATVERITFIGEANPLTTVLLRNGDTLQGILNQEDMRFALDIGGEVEIYQDRIDSVWLRDGYVPGSASPSVGSSSGQSASGRHDNGGFGLLFFPDRVPEEAAVLAEMTVCTYLAPASALPPTLERAFAGSPLNGVDVRRLIEITDSDTAFAALLTGECGALLAPVDAMSVWHLLEQKYGFSQGVLLVLPSPQAAP